MFIGKTEFAATSQSNIVKNALIAVREAAAEQLGLDKNQLTVDSPIPYIIGSPEGLDHFGFKDGALYEQGLIGAINAQRPGNKDKKLFTVLRNDYFKYGFRNLFKSMIDLVKNGGRHAMSMVRGLPVLLPLAAVAGLTYVLNNKESSEKLARYQ